MYPNYRPSPSKLGCSGGAGVKIGENLRPSHYAMTSVESDNDANVNPVHTYDKYPWRDVPRHTVSIPLIDVPDTDPHDVFSDEDVDDGIQNLDNTELMEKIFTNDNIKAAYLAYNSKLHLAARDALLKNVELRTVEDDSHSDWVRLFHPPEAVQIRTDRHGRYLFEIIRRRLLCKVSHEFLRGEAGRLDWFETFLADKEHASEDPANESGESGQS